MRSCSCVGAAVGFSALLGHLSESWVITTSTYKERIVEHTAWAVGALAIGIGVLPVLAGVAALARPKEEARDPATRAFVITSVASIAVFLLYAGVKGAYISTVFGTYVVERNLDLPLPDPLHRDRTRVPPRRRARLGDRRCRALHALVVAVTPLNLAQYPYYEARGLSMAAFANRELGWAEGTIEAFFIGLCVVAVVVVVVLKRLQPSSTAFAAVAGVAAVAVVAWSMTGQVYAAEAERTFSRQFDRNLPKPYEWVEDATGGGVGRRDRPGDQRPTNIWLTEFFNPSVRKMWIARRIGARGRRTDPDARPRRGRRDAHAVSRDRVRARRERGQAAGAHRRGEGERRPLQDRRRAARAAGHRRRPRHRRLDDRNSEDPDRARLVHALRRVERRARPRGRRADADRLVPERGQAAGRPGDGPHRPGRDRARQPARASSG